MTIYDPDNQPTNRVPGTSGYWVTGLLGAAMIVAPFVFRYVGLGAALWTDIALGAATVGLSLYGAYVEARFAWTNWVIAVLGILAIISPFVFGYTGDSSALWPNIVLGVAIAVMAAGDVFGQRRLNV